MVRPQNNRRAGHDIGQTGHFWGWIHRRRIPVKNEGRYLMPHVVIEEALDLAGACSSIPFESVRNGSEILKIVDVYLNRLNRTALVDCVAVEEGQAQSFFVQLSRKDRQITVRLLPATDPNKTVGVKRIMGTIAKQVHESIAGSRFGKTNLEEFLV
ncbi:MAG: hypothetical protein ACI9WU_002565 [Myxococcota bacterium]